MLHLPPSANLLIHVSIYRHSPFSCSMADSPCLLSADLPTLRPPSQCSPLLCMIMASSRSRTSVESPAIAHPLISTLQRRILLFSMVCLGLKMHRAIHSPAHVPAHRCYVGFTITGLRVSRNSDKEYPRNPMKVFPSRDVLAGLVVVSLVSSTVSSMSYACLRRGTDSSLDQIVTILLAYVAPKK